MLRYNPTHTRYPLKHRSRWQTFLHSARTFDAANPPKSARPSHFLRWGRRGQDLRVPYTKSCSHYQRELHSVKLSSSASLLAEKWGRCDTQMYFEIAGRESVETGTMARWGPMQSSVVMSLIGACWDYHWSLTKSSTEVVLSRSSVWQSCPMETMGQTMVGCPGDELAPWMLPVASLGA